MHFYIINPSSLRQLLETEATAGGATQFICAEKKYLIQLRLSLGQSS